jgi:hypothetical protein
MNGIISSDVLPVITSLSNKFVKPIWRFLTQEFGNLALGITVHKQNPLPL